MVPATPNRGRENHVYKKHLAALALVVFGGLTLAACGGDDSMSGMSGMDSSTPTPTDSRSSNAASEFNDADVTFATDMIPHHRQAVEMAALAESRADSPEVVALAEQIKQAQDPEIQTMSGWLSAWGEPVPEEMGGMDMSTSMPGMMSADEMDGLMNASGVDFDQMFLTMMIEHHRGAIEMAKAEQADGEYPDAVALAEEIETAQTEEIATMQGLLD